MTVKSETKILNGRSYFVVQMPPEQAFLTQLQLTKIMGGAIGALAPALSSSSAMGPDARTAAMAGAISALFATSTEQDIFNLMAKVVTTAKVDGERIDINKHFQGDYLADMYKVFFWVLGVNFASFFGAGGLDGILDRFRRVMAKELNSQETPPQTSTPSSGDQSQPDSAV